MIVVGVASCKLSLKKVYYCKTGFQGIFQTASGSNRKMPSGEKKWNPGCLKIMDNIVVLIDDQQKKEKGLKK